MSYGEFASSMPLAEGTTPKFTLKKEGVTIVQVVTPSPPVRSMNQSSLNLTSRSDRATNYFHGGICGQAMVPEFQPTAFEMLVTPTGNGDAVVPCSDSMLFMLVRTSPTFVNSSAS